jgi:hypothetical protein
MSLSPEFGSIYTTYQNHSGVATPRKHQASDSTLWVVIPIKRHMLRMRSRGSVGFVEPCLPSPQAAAGRAELEFMLTLWLRAIATLGESKKSQSASSQT